MNVDMLQSFLGWSVLINYVLLAVWFVVFGCCADWIYRLHRRWFVLTREQFDVIHYAGMALFKILTFMLFLAPYLALCIVDG
ncbi:MAG: DUF6868 family protein [Methylophaga sp.]